MTFKVISCRFSLANEETVVRQFSVAKSKKQNNKRKFSRNTVIIPLEMVSNRRRMHASEKDGK